MVGARVLYLFQKYLGGYIADLFVEASKIWEGDFFLDYLRLKAKDMSSVNLPVTVKAVYCDNITVQLFWKCLWNGTAIVLIDHIFVFVEASLDGHTKKNQDKKKLFESILQLRKAPSERSWLEWLIPTITGRCKVTINNVHIRYEDSISNPEHPFCCGVTLSKLVITTDEQDNETFDASGAFDKLSEYLQQLRLAVYHDTESAPSMFGKSWEDLDYIFQDRMAELDGNKTVSLWAKNLRYLTFPIDGALTFHTLGNLERQNLYKKVTFVLRDVYFTVSQTQYYSCIKVLEALSTYKTCMEVSHLIPGMTVLENTHAWWRFAMFASLQQKKLRCWFSWARIKHLCQLRRLYVQMYLTFLQQKSKEDIYAMRKIERILDLKVILLWRCLAHAKVESVDSMKRIWQPFGWLSVCEAQNYSKKIN